MPMAMPAVRIDRSADRFDRFDRMTVVRTAAANAEEPSGVQCVVLTVLPVVRIDRRAGRF